MESSRSPRHAFPSQRTLLSWLFGLRVFLALAGTLAALATRQLNPAAWTGGDEAAVIVSAVALLAILLTAHGYWQVWLRQAQPGAFFFAVQASIDLGLVTVLVHFSNGPQSGFSSLYVLLIAAYTALLSFSGGLAVVIAAALAFSLDAFLGYPTQVGFAFWGQLAVLGTVFALMSPMVSRLREASEQQASLQTELQRVRLEADDILRNIRSGVLTVDGAGRLAFINPMADRLLQINSETYLGLPVLDMLKHRSPELWAADRRRHPPRAQGEPRGGHGAARGRPHLPHRPLYHHLRRTGVDSRPR